MPKTALGGFAAKLAAIQREGRQPSTPAESPPSVATAATSQVELLAAASQAENREAEDQLGADDVLLDTPADDSLFLLLESDEESDEDEHRADNLEEFREMLRSDEIENLLDTLDPDMSTDPEEDPPEGISDVELAPVTENVIPTDVVASDDEAEDDEVKAAEVFNTTSEENLLQLFEAFYRINREPSDEQFHALATALGVPHEQLEEALFKLIGDAVSDESVGEHYGD